MNNNLTLCQELSPLKLSDDEKETLDLKSDEEVYEKIVCLVRPEINDKSPRGKNIINFKGLRWKILYTFKTLEELKENQMHRDRKKRVNTCKINGLEFKKIAPSKKKETEKTKAIPAIVYDIRSRFGKRFFIKDKAVF